MKRIGYIAYKACPGLSGELGLPLMGSESPGKLGYVRLLRHTWAYLWEPAKILAIMDI